MQNQEKKELTVIESIIKHSQNILILRVIKRKLISIKYIVSLSPVTITTSDQISNVIKDIATKIFEREHSIRYLLTKLFAGDEYDYTNQFSIDGLALKKGHLFLSKIITKDDKGTPIDTKPFILVLSDLKTDKKEFKAGQILPYHECVDSLELFPSVLGNFQTRINLISKILHDPCTILETIKDETNTQHDQ